jgi:hypothetical protein
MVYINRKIRGEFIYKEAVTKVCVTRSAITRKGNARI